MTDQEEFDQRIKLMNEDIRELNKRLDRLHIAAEVITGIKFDILDEADFCDLVGVCVDRSIHSINETVSLIIYEIREVNDTIAILCADRTMAPYFFRKEQEEKKNK